MQKYIPALILVSIIGYGIYNAKFRHIKDTKETPTETYIEHTKHHKTTHQTEELRQIGTIEYTKEYIMYIINHGSNQLHFKKDEVMEAGFAPATEASMIACYVIELSGKKCDKPYPKNAAMFYTSICGGCHGDDGKGLNGAYPDLTKDPLLGIAKRKEFLSQIVQ